MGAGASTFAPAQGSFVHAAGSGADGDIRRGSRHKGPLRRTAYEPSADGKDPGVLTLYMAFQRGLRVGPDRPVFGWRERKEAPAPPAAGGAGGDSKLAPLVAGEGAAPAPVVTYGAYKWMTYKEANARITAIGSGLRHLDLVPPAQEGRRFLGIFAKNRVEWSLTQNACAAYSVADVALYDTLGEEAVLFIVQQTGLAAIATDAAGALSLLKWKAGSTDAAAAALATLRAVVQFDAVTAEARAKFAAAGLQLLSLGEVEAAGTANPRAHEPPAPEDLAFLCYTSGTTGTPKGAMIRHSNIVALSSCADEELGLAPDDVHLSYLPLAHIFERLVQAAMLMSGGSMGFYQGDTRKITEDLAALRPTLFCSVPRLYNSESTAQTAPPFLRPTSDPP